MKTSKYYVVVQLLGLHQDINSIYGSFTSFIEAKNFARKHFDEQDFVIVNNIRNPKELEK